VDKPADTYMDGAQPLTMEKLVAAQFPLPPLPAGAARLSKRSRRERRSTLRRAKN
jgi:hypothetical protein